LIGATRQPPIVSALGKRETTFGSRLIFFYIFTNVINHMNFLLLKAFSNFKKSSTVIALPAVTLGSVLVVGAVEPLWC
jgi:hypothetical protein